MVALNCETEGKNEGKDDELRLMMSVCFTFSTYFRAVDLRRHNSEREYGRLKMTKQEERIIAANSVNVFNFFFYTNISNARGDMNNKTFVCLS